MFDEIKNGTFTSNLMEYFLNENYADRWIDLFVLKRENEGDPLNVNKYIFTWLYY